ncbi:hypothetical protein DACRYDRAFT_20899 [Dacryopinax primogenitus]|uniref:Uncharacterized protein n=1 Tax=Dacryopinax primogenitus (strain DJM 731) TaxID=1858805 RepID=M5GD81_DACPD|nr:uncharacterized protein DACRYDRAFT_20899 [Dacryopinax primogenitus]EJU04332.1 hypothetical protein DACRYDRAFT_20899 [Dacryopinax primogenitus]
MVAKRRHLEDTIAREEEVNGIAKRLFTDLTPRKESTRVETPKKPKKVAHIPPPESTSRPMPPPSTPGRTAPPKTPAASLSMPSSTSSNPLLTPSEDNKENLPPRRRRTHPSLPLSAGKTITPSTPKVYSAPHLGRSNGNGKEVVPRFAHKLSGKPSTPREIGREMLMEEVDEPEEVDDVF